MAERTKYEEWLRELEAKRDSTPPSVFARVHADYTTRLNAVAEQLKQHTRSMQEHAGNLMAKLRELEASAKKLEDEVAESRIRKDVGELSSNEFDSLSKKAQRELTRLEDDQERIATDLNRIRHMLGGPRSADEDLQPRTSRDFDELEFLKSVVGTATPAATPVPTRSTPTSSPRSTPSSAPAAAAPARAPTAPAAPAVNTPPPQPPAPEAPADGPLALRPSGGMEQPKTLKCAECGSMNYPSEWYCERCGAELANI